jgi:hypothetical protein
VFVHASKQKQQKRKQLTPSLDRNMDTHANTLKPFPFLVEVEKEREERF